MLEQLQWALPLHSPRRGWQIGGRLTMHSTGLLVDVRLDSWRAFEVRFTMRSDLFPRLTHPFS